VALTTAQLNAHIRTLLLDQFNAERVNREALLFMVRACVRHVRLGGADNIEAGRTVGEFLLQQVLGRSLTAGDLHYLRKHLVTDADETAAGVLG
jgi:hypothetical protein